MYCLLILFYYSKLDKIFDFIIQNILRRINVLYKYVNSKIVNLPVHEGPFRG